ncbi:MAG: tetratricopeptide repeat protein [Planctomycetes bacterium]|nr:tetratricopeptide repeat protein [Planctomycetota bacterium]
MSESSSTPSPSPPSAPGASSERALPTRAAVVILVASSLVAWAVALRGEFLWDDLIVIVRNHTLKHGLSFLEALGKPYPHGEGYRPLALWVFAREYDLFGLAPAGFHALNVLVHTVNTLLVFGVARRLLEAPRVAFTAALLFAVHPVHGEPVANIAQLDELLALCFYLLGWLSWLRGGTAGLCGALAAYVFALLSKEQAVTLPGALLLTDVFLGRLRDRRSALTAIGRCALFVLPLGLCVLLRYNALGSLGAGMGGHRTYFEGRSGLVAALSTGSFFVRHYLPGLLLGANLSCDYARPSLPDASPGDVLAWLELGLVLGGAVAAFALLCLRRSVLAFGIALAYVSILTVSNLVFPIWAIGAQRYLYFPSVGYCLAVAAGLAAVRAKSFPAALVAEVVLVVVYLLLAIQEAGVWRDGLSLYTTMLERAPDNPSALINLGREWYGRGQEAKAIPLYERAAALDPDDVIAEVNLAAIDFDHRRYDEALVRLRRVQGRGKNDRELPWIAAANVLREQGKIADARASLAKAMEVALPGAHTLGEVYFRLGEIDLDEGKVDDAERSLRRATELDPESAPAAGRLGVVLLGKKQPEEAATWLRRAVTLDPLLGDAWNELGMAVEELGKLDEAEDAYRRSIGLLTADGAPHQNYGLLLMKQGRAREAADEFSEALRLTPATVDARFYLGLALSKQGRDEQAVGEWRDFLKAAGDDPRWAKQVEWVKRRLTTDKGGK